jgi:hypothetical protein
MKVISYRVDKYKGYVGKTFTCGRTGTTYEIEKSDIEKASAESKRNFIAGVKCPDCGALVSFESDQREGDFIIHT